MKMLHRNYCKKTPNLPTTQNLKLKNHTNLWLQASNSGLHHSGKPGITCNNMVQPIMLDNLQGKYTLDPTTSMQLHLVW